MQTWIVHFAFIFCSLDLFLFFYQLQIIIGIECVVNNILKSPIRNYCIQRKSNQRTSLSCLYCGFRKAMRRRFSSSVATRKSIGIRNEFRGSL